MATTSDTSSNSNNGTSNSSLTVQIKALNISLAANNNNNNDEEEKDSHCGTTDDFESPTSTPSSPKTFYVKHSVLSKIGKWNKLQNYGHTALGDAVIPLKTPIDHKYLAGTHWPRFSIHDFVFEQWRDYGRLIGMMIDLSNHDCIYDYETILIPTTTITTACDTAEEAPPSVLNNNFEKKSHLEYMGLSYVKHRCISKECPDLTNIRAFMKIVYDFKQQYPNHYIGVHCSYGFNRTGFVLCSFLAESGVGVDDAVRLFAESRQPGIKHKWFIEELKLRYDVERSQALSASPAQPTTSQSSSSSEGPMTTATITKSTEEEESLAHDQETYK